MACTIKEISEICENFLECIAIIVGGIWVYFRFVRTRENHPKIQFDVAIRYLGRQDGRILIEVVGIVSNKGLVRHWVRDFVCDVLTLRNTDKVAPGEEWINYQVQFKKENPIKPQLKDGTPQPDRITWVPEDWRESYIDPGVEQRYTYLTSISSDASFVSIFSRFFTKDGDPHTSQRTFSIAELEAA